MALIDRRFLNVQLVVQGTFDDVPTGITPHEGLQCIVGSSPTGGFAGAAPNDIAVYEGGVWKFFKPSSLELFDIEKNALVHWDGSEYSVVLSLEHNEFYELHSMTDDNVVNKSFSLDYRSDTLDNLEITVILNGLTHIQGVDYELSRVGDEVKVSWDGLCFDEVGINSDDVFLVHVVTKGGQGSGGFKAKLTVSTAPGASVTVTGASRFYTGTANDSGVVSFVVSEKCEHSVASVLNGHVSVSDNVIDITDKDGTYSATANLVLLTQPITTSSLVYTGETQAPVWQNYDEDELDLSGDANGQNAGDYTTVFTPKSGYQWSDGTVLGVNLDWAIDRAEIELVPSQSGVLSELDDASAQSPSWLNYDSEQLTLSGDISEGNPGTYTAIFTPKANYKWKDGTIEAKDVSWVIQPLEWVVLVTLNAGTDTNPIPKYAVIRHIYPEATDRQVYDVVDCASDNMIYGYTSYEKVRMNEAQIQAYEDTAYEEGANILVADFLDDRVTPNPTYSISLNYAKNHYDEEEPKINMVKLVAFMESFIDAQYMDSERNNLYLVTGGYAARVKSKSKGVREISLM